MEPLEPEGTWLWAAIAALVLMTYVTNLTCVHPVLSGSMVDGAGDTGFVRCCSGLYPDDLNLLFCVSSDWDIHHIGFLLHISFGCCLNCSRWIRSYQWITFLQFEFDFHTKSHRNAFLCLSAKVSNMLFTRSRGTKEAGSKSVKDDSKTTKELNDHSLLQLVNNSRVRLTEKEREVLPEVMCKRDPELHAHGPYSKCMNLSADVVGPSIKPRLLELKPDQEMLEQKTSRFGRCRRILGLVCSEWKNGAVLSLPFQAHCHIRWLILFISGFLQELDCRHQLPVLNRSSRGHLDWPLGLSRPLVFPQSRPQSLNLIVDAFDVVILFSVLDAFPCYLNFQAFRGLLTLVLAPLYVFSLHKPKRALRLASAELGFESVCCFIKIWTSYDGICSSFLPVPSFSTAFWIASLNLQNRVRPAHCGPYLPIQLNRATVVCVAPDTLSINTSMYSASILTSPMVCTCVASTIITWACVVSNLSDPEICTCRLIIITNYVHVSPPHQNSEPRSEGVLIMFFVLPKLNNYCFEPLVVLAFPFYVIQWFVSPPIKTRCACAPRGVNIHILC
jgi:hypothetical protein